LALFAAIEIHISMAGAGWITEKTRESEHEGGTKDLSEFTRKGLV